MSVQLGNGFMEILLIYFCLNPLKTQTENKDNYKHTFDNNKDNESVY